MNTQTRQLIKTALAEDIGRGDITTNAVVPAKLCAEGKIIAKEDMVLAGIDIAHEVFKMIGRGIKWKAFKKDGELCGKGGVIAEVKGPARALLSGERVALNFLQHLSGVSTSARIFSEAISGTKAKILDTRKTTPGLRGLEKYAVEMGGGTNHRMGLFDHFLIKNNHVAVAGSVTEAMKRAKKKKKKGQKIEVETRNINEVKEALSCKADVIMLDNIGIDDVRKAVFLAKGKVPLEVSGNISLENIRRYAETGVDFISVGAITHSARAVDVHMIIVA